MKRTMSASGSETSCASGSPVVVSTPPRVRPLTLTPAASSDWRSERSRRQRGARRRPAAVPAAVDGERGERRRLVDVEARPPARRRPARVEPGLVREHSAVDASDPPGGDLGRQAVQVGRRRASDRRIRAGRGRRARRRRRACRCRRPRCGNGTSGRGARAPRRRRQASRSRPGGATALRCARRRPRRCAGRRERAGRARVDVGHRSAFARRAASGGVGGARRRCGRERQRSATLGRGGARR